MTPYLPDANCIFKIIDSAYTGAYLICQTVVVLKIGFSAFLRASARIAVFFLHVYCNAAVAFLQNFVCDRW